jgi:hypothetical protein
MATKNDATPTTSGGAPSGADGVAVITPPMPWYKQLLAIKDTIIIILTPLVFLPLIIVYQSKVSENMSTFFF